MNRGWIGSLSELNRSTANWRRTLIATRTMDHMRGMLKAPGVPGETADPRVTATASAISTADAILAAVAMFLARQEAKTPETS